MLNISVPNPPGVRPPPRELFFAPLEAALDPGVLERVHFAYIASKYGHARQERDDGTRYFDHPKGAAWIYIDELGGRDADIIINILLHDLSEDQYLLSPFRIALNFGEERALDTRALTKLPKHKEQPREYLARVIARGPRVIVAKLCDRLHNCRTLGSCAEEKQKRQVAETRELYLGVLIPSLREFGEEWASYAMALDKKLLEALAPFG